MRISMGIYPRIYYLLPLILGFTHCTEEKKISLEVSTYHYDKSPVLGAEVFSDKNLICKTGIKGTCEGSFILDSDPPSTISIEIKKPSDVYYYAPYFASFDITDRLNDPIKITTTLFNVPKQVSTDSVSPEDQKLPENSDSLKDTTKETLNTENITADDETEKTDTSISQEEEPEVTANDAVSPLANTIKSDELQVSSLNQLLKTIGISPQDSLLREIISGSFVDIQSAPASVIDYKKFNNHIPRDKKVLLSLHALNGNAPISNARFYFKEGIAEYLICSTNERGHCLSTITQPFLGQKVNILGKASDLKSVLKEVGLEEKTNLYFQFERSDDVDVTVIEDNLWHSRPLSQAPVGIGQDTIGNTDSTGKISIPKNKKDLWKKNGLTFRQHSGKTQNLPAESIISSQAILAGDAHKPFKVFLLEPFIVSSEPKNTIFNASQLSKSHYLDLKKNLFVRKIFREFPREDMRKYLAEKGLSIFDLTQSGWQRFDLDLDIIAIPTIVVGKTPKLQLLFLDDEGQALAGSMTAEIDDADGDKVQSSLGKEAVKKIVYNLPFLTAVTHISEQKFEIAAGDNFDSQILAGDKVLLIDLNHQNNPIAEGEISKVTGDSSQVTLKDTSILFEKNHLGAIVRPPRSLLTHAENSSIKVEVRGLDEEVLPYLHPGVPIFVDGSYQGTTDASGGLVLSKDTSSKHQIIETAIPGYLSKALPIPSDKKELVLTLEAGPTHARFASSPVGTEVIIDETIKTKTFFVGLLPNTPLEKDSHLIRFLPKSGYKPLTFSLSNADRKAINFNHTRRVYLPRDELSKARDQLSKNKIEDATAILRGIPAEDPSFLEAQNLIAKTFLLGDHSIDEILDIVDQKIGKGLSETTRLEQNQKTMAAFNASMIHILVGSILIGHDDYKAKIFLNKAYQDLVKINNDLIGSADLVQEDTQRSVAYFSALSLHFLYSIEKKTKQKNLLTALWKSYFNMAQKSAEPHLSKASDFAKQLITRDESLKRIIF